VTAPIRLVLADDKLLTRGAVGALLGLKTDLVVVGEAVRATRPSRGCRSTIPTSR